MELLLVLLIVLLVFGATRLPQIGEALGKAIRNFRKGLSGEEDKKKEQIDASKTDSSDTKKDGPGQTK
jgi:sec-independent protein translocase protein TatA